MTVAMIAVAAMLGTSRFVDSSALNANAGPRLVASASLAPPPFAAPRR
jgi:L-asparagine transporter-like permease